MLTSSRVREAARWRFSSSALNPFDAIVVPVGGGGLIAGISLVSATLRPQTEIIGVESSRCPSMTAALQAQRPVQVVSSASLADGLAVPEVGALSFEVARSRIARVVTVSEESITRAILRIAEGEKGVVEGAGATPLAAFMEGKLKHLEGKKVVLVLCGGNIDPATLSRCVPSHASRYFITAFPFIKLQGHRPRLGSRRPFGTSTCASHNKIL